MKREMYFTLVMAFMMSLTMCSYNIVCLYGVGGQFKVVFMKEWLFEYLCAVVVIRLFVAKTALAAVEFFVGGHLGALKFKLIMPSAMVGLMVPVMSFLSLAVWNGFDELFLQKFLQALGRNYPMAWVCQVLIIGPMVRMFFQRIAQMKTMS